MKARDLLVEFYDPADDELGKAKMDDTRRPRLTMLHLQKLRKARDAEKYETAQHLDFLPAMYAPPPEEAGPPAPGGL
jgi:hypothetical protein